MASDPAAGWRAGGRGPLAHPPPSVWAVWEDGAGAGRPGTEAVGEPPLLGLPPGPVGEAQLLPGLRAQVTAQDNPPPPPDAAEMAVPSCRLLPAPLEPQARKAGEVGPGEGCPTQGWEQTLGTLALPGGWPVTAPPRPRSPHVACKADPAWRHVARTLCWGLDGGAPSHSLGFPCPAPAQLAAVPPGCRGPGGSPGRAVPLLLYKNNRVGVGGRRHPSFP